MWRKWTNEESSAFADQFTLEPLSSGRISPSGEGANSSTVSSRESKEVSIKVDELVRGDEGVIGLGSSVLLGEYVGRENLRDLENGHFGSGGAGALCDLLSESADVSIGRGVAAIHSPSARERGGGRCKEAGQSLHDCDFGGHGDERSS